MGMRNWVMDTIGSLLDFGRVAATKQDDETKNVLASIEGNTTDDETQTESRPYQQLWGCAAIIYRPPVDTEVLYVRRGEEMLPIASREVRWQVDVEEGEVCIRNLIGDTDEQARIYLKANGNVVIDAKKVYIGDGSATEKIALGTAIKGHLDDLKTWADNHKHSYIDDATGPLLTTAPVVDPPGTSPNPSPSVPDVESRHVVEN